MKKFICAFAVIVSAVVISGCDDQQKVTDNFSGQWKAVSKEMVAHYIQNTALL